MKFSFLREDVHYLEVNQGYHPSISDGISGNMLVKPQYQLALGYRQVTGPWTEDTVRFKGHLSNGFIQVINHSTESADALTQIILFLAIDDF